MLERPLDPRLVSPQLEVALAYRGEQLRGGLADRLLAEFARPTPLGRGADELAARESMKPPEVLVLLYSLLWHQRLRLNFTRPFNLGADVWA